MSNEYFTESGNPSTNASATSATMRAEFTAVGDGFDKLPTLAGNGSKILAVNSGASALEAITTTGTGSGVRATAPTLTSAVLVTPTLGVASTTSINKLTITAPATSATLTIADGKTLTASDTMTLALASYTAVQGGVGFVNGWVNFGDPYAPTAFWKDAFGIVHIHGAVKSGTAAPGTTLFTLPAGYRPAKRQTFPVAGNLAYGEIFVDTNGAVIIDVGTNVLLSLDGVTFLAT